MTNIVMIAKDRERLTIQAVQSLIANTDCESYTLTFIDDGSFEYAEDNYGWPAFIPKPKYCRSLRLGQSIGIVGWLRNVGASASERYFGRGDWLYFSDCDVAFFPRWLEKMRMVMDMQSAPAVLGGCRHPFHGLNILHSLGRFGWQSTDAVAGYSLLMRWETFDKYGPFADNQKGVGASEDFALCRKIVEDGGKVGYIHPPVLAHTGVTNTDGKPATGADQFIQVPGVLYE